MELAKSVKNKNKHFETLYFALSFKCAQLLNSNNNLYCHIFDGTEGVCLYFSTRWVYQKNHVDNKAWITQIISDIRNNFTIDKTYEMLTLIDEKLDFCKTIIRDNPIKIIFLDHSYKGLDSFYSWGTASNRKIIDEIMLTHANENSVHPLEHTLLHQLGHLAYIRITGNDNVPDDFIMIQKKIL